MIYKVTDIDKNYFILGLQNYCFNLKIEEKFIYDAKEKFEFGCMMVKLNHPIFKKVVKKDDFDFKTFAPVFNLIAYTFRWKYNFIENEMNKELKNDPELIKKIELRWVRFLNRQIGYMLKNPGIVYNLMKAYANEECDTTRLSIDEIISELMDKYVFDENERKFFDNYFETGVLG